MPYPAGQDLFCILYHSHELLPDEPGLAAVELGRIFASAQRNNAPAGVTGVLMYGHGSFVQVLEGPQGPVQAIFDAILADPRHEDLTVLHTGRVARRAFAEWSMAPIRDWDASHRVCAVMDLLDRRAGPGPSSSSLLNFLLGTMVRRAGRDWTPAPAGAR